MKNITFEEALENLEKTVERLESGDLPLEKALQEFEKGVRMSRLCSQKLEEAEKKVELLLNVTNGKPQTSLFDMKNLNE
jgi:exodeoxyribonuclease VII small subunit